MTTQGNGTSDAVELSYKYGASEIANIVFVPFQGADKLVITVDGKPVTNLAEHIITNGVNTYLIVASVAATDEYSALVDTVRLVITKADNSWSSPLAISGWTWGDTEANIKNKLTFPVAAQGSTALVTVKRGSTVSFEATVSYGEGRVVNSNDLDALVRRLAALDVVDGGYTITVTVRETDIYSALDGAKAQVGSFTIAQAENSWVTEPIITGWNFGGDTAYPSATPVFGKNTVVFSYAPTSANDTVDGDGNRIAPAADAEWAAAPSSQAGSYWLRAQVPATANYEGLVGYHLFSINAAKNDWVNMPGVVEWNWNGYDATINLFSGSARSNKPAKFAIAYVGDTALDANAFDAHDSSVNINPTAIAKLGAFYLDKTSMTVSSEVAALLNALKPGTYLLKVTVEGGESLQSLSGSTTFIVGKADNGWATDDDGVTLAPTVRYYNYGENDVFTPGTPLYGTVSYKIRRLTGTAQYIDITTDIETTLQGLGVGTYELRAWVVAASGASYKSLYSEEYPYIVSFVVSPVINSWDTAPKTAVSEYHAVIHGATFDVAAWLGSPVAAKGNDTLVYTIMTVGLSTINYTSDYDTFVNNVKALGAGEYIVRFSVAADATTNYSELSQNMSLTVKRYNSKFTAIPTKLTGKWKQDAAGQTATVLDDATITAYSYIEGGANVAELDVQYILAGTTTVTCDSFAELKDAVKSLRRGSYQVTVQVLQTDEYDGLSSILQLDIAAGDNGWVTGGDAPAPEDSFIVLGDNDKEPITQWTWSTQIDWLGVKPLYGDNVVIRIVSSADANNVLKYFSVNTGSGFDTQRELVSSYVSKLDVGSYVMIITVPSGDNWNGIDDATLASGAAELPNTTSTRIAFTIVEAANGWKSEEDKPHFDGNGVTYEGGVYKWMYNASVSADAKALHGTVNVAYSTVDGQALSGMPTTVGTYKAVFTVAKPTPANYAAIDGANAVTLTFTVEGVPYEAFDVLGIIGWAWNNYDRTTNVISAKPRSGGNVHFAVTDDKGALIVDKFDLVDAEGNHHNNYDRDIYVPTTVAAKLKALTEGSYTLRVFVDAKDNYEAFDTTTPFKVTVAANTWEETPKIASWYRGGWSEAKNSPVAVSRYGAPVVVITSNASGETLYRAVYNETTGEYDASVNQLDAADAGWYTMYVDVDGLEGKYSSIPTVEVEFQIFIQGSPDDKNFWEVTPGIEGWTATVDGKVTMPTGKPVRGKPYFVFFKAKLDGDEYKLDGKVEAGVDALTVKKGDAYAQDFYIPMAPGTYYMYAYAINAAVPADALDEDDSSRVMLIIRNRANSWEKSVGISSIMYLGDRGNWAAPVAKASLPNSEITYKYLDAATRADLGATMPTAAGKYIVVASADCRYSLPIESEMEFEVLESKNYWVSGTSPSIENWTEGNLDNRPDPVGEAAFGTIVYTYLSKANPNEKERTDKPIDAGDYIMIARVKLDGYETLEARYEFTIEPAFDRTLVTIDIVLGVVACAFAVVVIIFAIRRYKEN